MRSLRLLVPAILLFATGCHSAFIEATISNRTDKPISLVELDYPSASFGTQTLAPNQDFHYRFKVLGSGNLKLIYTDASNSEHNVLGPKLAEGDEGKLSIWVQPSAVSWLPELKGRKTDDATSTPN